MCYLFSLFNKYTDSSIKKKYIELNQNLIILQTKNSELQSIVNDKVLEIQQLKASLQDQVLLASKAKDVSAEVLLAHNDMTQFYIKTAGSICVVALVFGSFYYLSGFSFSAKALLPAGFYELIQDNSYFFQTSRVYNFYETNSHSDWLIKIINEKHVNLTVKPEFSSDFIDVGDFILSLHSNAGTLAVRLASEVAVSPLFSAPVEPLADPLAAAALATYLSNIL